MKTLFAITLSSLFATTAFAGTAINCYEVNNMEKGSIEVCQEQTNRHLNENYQQLQKNYKIDKESLKLLKEMQLAWIKMRDAQCNIRMRHVGSNAALAGMTCEVILTQKRSDELEKMASDGDFASF